VITKLDEVTLKLDEFSSEGGHLTAKGDEETSGLDEFIPGRGEGTAKAGHFIQWSDEFAPEADELTSKADEATPTGDEARRKTDEVAAEGDELIRRRSRAFSTSISSRLAKPLSTDGVSQAFKSVDPGAPTLDAATPIATAAGMKRSPAVISPSTA
jgi:hypothetical protein